LDAALADVVENKLEKRMFEDKAEFLDGQLYQL